VFCVNSLENPTTLGKTIFHLPNTQPICGIALAANAPPIALFHEILHACGLHDIFIDGLDGRLVNAADIGSFNWSGGSGTGYYPSDLTITNLIKTLMMYGYQGGAVADIPLTDLNWPFTWGVDYQGNPQKDTIRVSRNAMVIREPRH